MVDPTCRPGSKGSSCTGKERQKPKKNKAEGELQVCQRACSSVTGQFVGLSGSASLFVLSLTPTGTGGKWAQLSSMRAMRARRAQGRAGRQGSAGLRDGDSKPQEEWNNQQSDALATMTEDGGSWTVGGGSWSSRVAWPGGHLCRPLSVESVLVLPGPRQREDRRSSRASMVDALDDRCVEVRVGQVDCSTSTLSRDAVCRMPMCLKGWQSG